MARVQVCLADAATRASVVAAAVARARARRAAPPRPRRPPTTRPLQGGGGGGGEAATDRSLPPSPNLGAARTHLSKAVAAAKDDDAVFLAEYRRRGLARRDGDGRVHHPRGGTPASRHGLRSRGGGIGAFTFFYFRFGNSADVAFCSQGAYAKDTSGHERLTVANIFAALADARLHTVVDKADEELAAGNTGELLATLAPLLLEAPSRSAMVDGGGGARRRGKQDGF